MDERLFPRRIFGKTGVSVPIHSCGGTQYIHSWRKGLTIGEIPWESQSNAQAVVDQAMKMGINHFECAGHYGTNELQLGLALQKYERDSYLLHSMIDPAVDKHDFWEQLETTLKHLGTDSFDFLSLHGLNTEHFYEWLVKPNGGLEWAEEIRKRGICRFIGFTTHANNELIEKIINTDGFDFMYLHYYFTDQSNSGAIELARKKNLGVRIISPNYMGGNLFEPPKTLVELCDPIPPAAFNSMFCLAHEHIHTLSLGAKSPQDFQFHLDSIGEWLPKLDVVKQIQERLENQIDEVMGKDWHKRWQEGLPVWHESPGKMNIRQILRLFTAAKCLGLESFARRRYNQLGTSGHWFPGSKVKISELSQLDDCVGSSPYADRLKDYLIEAHSLLDGDPTYRLSDGSP